MSYIVEKLEKSQAKLSFDITPETFAKACEEAYQKTKHKYAIAGFRKGHAPRKVIEGIYGKGVFFEDAMDIVIPEAYGEALNKEESLDVVAQPELSSFDFKDDGGATFVLIVTVKPEVKLGAYKGLGIEKKTDEIGAEAIDAEIEKTRAKQARLIDVDDAAANGNIVTIDFEGSVDGVKFEGGSAEKYDLELGSGSFIPGFEEQLVGIKAGGEKDVKVTFPDDYGAEELKGKEAVFACKAHAVKVKELPEVNDDFVKEISEFDTIAEYKADIENKLKTEAAERSDREFEDAVIDAVVGASQVEVPEAMIDDEAEDMIKEFEYRLQYQGLKLDDYLKYLNMTVEQLKEEYKPQAAKSVKVRLVMEAIVKAEELKFEDAEIEEKIAKLAVDMGNKPVEEFKKTLKREQLDYIVNQILSEKLIELLKKENIAGAKPAAAKKAAAKAKAAVGNTVVADNEAKPAAEKKPKAKKDAEKPKEDATDNK